MIVSAVRLICLVFRDPTESVKQHQQVQHRQCDTQTDTSHARIKTCYPPMCVFMCLCLCVCLYMCVSLEPQHHLPHPVQSCLTEAWWRDAVVVVASVTLSDCQAHLQGQVMIRITYSQTLTNTHARTCAHMTVFPSLSTSTICCGKLKNSKD